MIPFYTLITLILLLILGLAIFYYRLRHKLKKASKQRTEHAQSLREIVESGGINITDQNGNTPLILAIRYDFPEIINLLIQQNPNLQHANHNGNTALHFASILAHETQQQQIITTLIKAGALLETTNNSGQTPTWMAAAANNLTNLQTLVHHGASLQLADKNGHTPLMAAVLAKSYETVNWIATQPINHNTADKQNHTAHDLCLIHWPEIQTQWQKNKNSKKATPQVQAFHQIRTALEA